MNVLSALTVALLFGVGVQLMVGRDAVRLIAGTLLISNAAILLLMSFALHRRVVPLLPVEDPELVSDPLVQALALTAVVIGFGTTVLLVRIGVAVERTHDTIELGGLTEAEEVSTSQEEDAHPGGAA